MRTDAEYKQAAIEQWTADPCESPYAEGEPGTLPYLRGLLEARSSYGPWMPEAVGYLEAAGKRVLDVGCGQGLDLIGYAQAGAEPTGIDMTPRHVELALAHLRALGLPGAVVEGDAESMPFDNASFDHVSSNGVLHHTPDMPGALREIHRVLRPGGQARVLVYNKASFHYWLNQVLIEGIARGGLRQEGSMEGVLSRNVEVSSVGARPLVRVYRPRELRRMMRDAGFTRVRTSVRHFRPSDTFVTAALESRISALRDQRMLDRIGRVGGWYVVGVGGRD